MYLASPAEGLQVVRRAVRPDGIIAFQEIDMGVPPPVSAPSLDLRDALFDTIARTFRAARCHVEMARALPLAFAGAGIKPTGTSGEFLIASGDGAIFEWATKTFRNLYPLALSEGIVDATSGSDTLIDDLREVLRRSENAYWSPFFVAVHGTTPVAAA